MVAGTNRSAALRAVGPQVELAARAEIEMSVYGTPALWAVHGQRLSHYEVEDGSDQVGHEKRDEEPEHRAHATALCVCPNVTVEQHDDTEHNHDSSHNAEHRKQLDRNRFSNKVMRYPFGHVQGHAGYHSKGQKI